MGGVPHLPLTVIEPCVRSSVDTAENRFVKYFAGLALELIAQARDLLAAVDCDVNLQAQARQLAERLGEMTSADWLTQVGDLERFPAHSQVMQKRFGYRDILRHYLALVFVSRYPLAAADLTRIVETKSASTLYEYWTFFELAEAIGDRLGEPTEAVKTLEVRPFASVLAEGIRLTFPPTAAGAVELWYNRAFSRSATAAHRSYSVPLRPDITLRVGDRLHLFDAKFRVERFEILEIESGSEALIEQQLAIEDEAERHGQVTQGWFKHADIHKMHAYRDAIGGEGRRVGSVWVLYPGDQFRFFAEDATRADTGEAVARLASAGALRGVGAIPMVPGAGERFAELGAVLKAVL
jgi:predicted component of viral defense system (DUF524 family)